MDRGAKRVTPLVKCSVGIPGLSPKVAGLQHVSGIEATVESEMVNHCPAAMAFVSFGAR